jgi:hypothetical protein
MPASDLLVETVRQIARAPSTRRRPVTRICGATLGPDRRATFTESFVETVGQGSHQDCRADDPTGKAILAAAHRRAARSQETVSTRRRATTRDLNPFARW